MPTAIKNRENKPHKIALTSHDLPLSRPLMLRACLPWSSESRGLWGKSTDFALSDCGFNRFMSAYYMVPHHAKLSLHIR